MNNLLRRPRGFLWSAVILGLLILLPLIVPSNYVMRVAVTVVLYAVLASSLNIINGFSGQFNIGQAGFYCLGAYTAGILATRFHWSFLLLLPLSGLVAALFGCLLGLPTLRLKGIYLTICTLGFSEIIRLTVLNWTSLTRGPFGIPGIPFPTLFGVSLKSNAQFYYLILVIATVMILSTHRILTSRVGRAWLAIREDELAARAMGVQAFGYKLLNLAIGTFWAGVAGGFYAYFASYISADSFKLDEGFSILAMVLVGGQGSLVGPLVGALLLTVLPEVFRGLAEYRMVVFGLMIVLTMYVRPQGIAGSDLLPGWLTRRRRPAGGHGPATEVR